MFGKLTIEIDKGSLLGALAFVGASFSCLIISHAVILFIKGHEKDRWARLKGLFMLVTGLCLLSLNVFAILKTELILKKLPEFFEYLCSLGFNFFDQ